MVEFNIRIEDAGADGAAAVLALDERRLLRRVQPDALAPYQLKEHFIANRSQSLAPVLDL